MAVPSSIVLTPDESLDSALPIVANVTATDICSTARALANAQTDT